MLEIFINMVKEEWRIHSSMFGGLMFALFPVLIAVFSFAGTVLMPVFTRVMPEYEIMLFTHYAFLLFGMSIGAFGLMGREVMNRRFGSASLIAFSSRTLPVSMRVIFANFIAKDVLYYFSFWILPFVSGFFFASLVTGIGLAYSAILLLTLTLSFMVGLSLVFFLSTIYAHSVKLLGVLLALTAIVLVVASGGPVVVQLMSFPPFMLFNSLSLWQFAVSLFFIAVPFLVSLAFLKVDYPERKRAFRNSFDGLVSRLSFSSQGIFTAKDLLDLRRSEGGLGKIIFSLIFPLVLIWYLIYFFTGFFPGADPFLLFSMFAGVISSTAYNWLTEFDVPSSYSFLPVRVSGVIRSKVTGYVFMNIPTVAILIAVMAATGSWLLFLPSFVCFLSFSAYGLAVLIFIAGLSPNTLLYNSRVFLEYMALLLPPILLFIFASALSPAWLLGSVVLLPLAWFLGIRGLARWDRRGWIG